MQLGKGKEEDYIKCPKCGKMIEKSRVIRKKYVCYECGGYFRVRTNNRIRMVADLNTFEPWFEDMPVSNPLSYEGYEEKLEETREKTGLKEAVTVGKCKVFGEEAVLGVCDARFMMASMGHVVGEKITRAIEKATELKLPVFLFCNVPASLCIIASIYLNETLPVFITVRSYALIISSSSAFKSLTQDKRYLISESVKSRPVILNFCL